jgi:hypothetical protein
MKTESIHPAAPDYCTQNGGHCPTCSLVNYRRDCMNNPVNYEKFERIDADRNSDKDGAGPRR